MEGYAKRLGAGLHRLLYRQSAGQRGAGRSAAKKIHAIFRKARAVSPAVLLWAASGTVWCKRDNGTWGPNYANVDGQSDGRRRFQSVLPRIRSHGRRHIWDAVLPSQPRRLSAAKSSNSGPTWCATTGENKRKSWPGRERAQYRVACSANHSNAPRPPTLRNGLYRGVTLTTLARQDRTPWQVSGLQVFGQADLHRRQPVIAAAQRETPRRVARIGRRKSRQQGVRSDPICITARANVRRQLHGSHMPCEFLQNNHWPPVRSRCRAFATRALPGWPWA